MTIAGEGDGHQDREVIRQIDAGSIPAGFNLGRDGITDGGCQIAVEAATSSVRLGTQRQGSRSGELRERCAAGLRSEEHTSELQSLMRISYAVFCLKKKKEETNTMK